MSEPTLPCRVQRTRTKGGGMPTGAVYVGRPSKWGNPFPIAGSDGPEWATERFRKALDAGGFWTYHFGKWTSIGDIKRELRGKDLACWCPLSQPCHAEVLLEIANTERKD